MKHIFETNFRIVGKMKYEVDSSNELMPSEAEDEATRLLYEMMDPISVDLDDIRIEMIDTNEIEHDTEDEE